MTIPAGWYDDPRDRTRHRWWDGAEWTPWERIDAPAEAERHLWSRPGVGRGWTVLANVLQVLFTVQVVVAALTVVTYWQLRAELTVGIERPRAMDAGVLDTVAGAETPLLVAMVATALTSYVLFIIWLYRGYRSNRVDAARLPRGAGWAIGAWFIPLVNLVLPALVVHDLNQASRPLGESRAGLVTTWWVAFLAWGFLIQAGGPLPDDDLPVREYLRQLQGSVDLTLAGEAVGIVASVLGVLLVRRLTHQVRTSPYGPRRSEPLPEVSAS
ncbi:hypothetical protein GCM10009623_29010 [Nocardioides aestuarii]|uniref:DUF4328 domain-containing protein n=1 Tax=Nocardioides aestuarii TaxID=252231 RepID=A0ABW4TQ13_9ACTN